jgi:hypothetical protein
MRSTPTRSALARCCLLVAALALSACALPYRQIPASGVVYGQAVETRVDSPLAAYFLEHFDDWRESDSAHARELVALPECSAASLGRDELKQLSVRTSVDVAGLYAAKCLIEANRDIGNEFAQIFSHIQGLSEPAAAKREGMLDQAQNFAVLVVPGWDYIDSGSVTGADFARQLQQFSELGIASYRAPIDQNGGVEENAAVVRSEISRISRIHEQLIVVSASSSSPAVALALGDPVHHADLTSVRAWLNLGGILGGMRLIDSFSDGLGYVALRTFTFFNGWDMDDVESMSAARSHERLAKTRLPAHLVVINYIGIPFSGDVSSRVSFFYSRLRAHGPNDGLTLVTDPVLPGTHTLVALGQDHFFADDPELEARTLALAALITREVARKSEELNAGSRADEPSLQLVDAAAH